MTQTAAQTSRAPSPRHPGTWCSLYLAAPFVARNAVRDIADELRTRGVGCTSTWLDSSNAIDAGAVGPASALTDHRTKVIADQDLEDVKRADGLVQFAASWFGIAKNDPLGHSGGRHFEAGYAHALGRPVLVIGEPENIFQRALPQRGADLMNPGDLDKIGQVVFAWVNALPMVEVDR